MSINAGLGIANFPFEVSKGFWRWVDMCESGGIDSLWQSDRIISTEPLTTLGWGFRRSGYWSNRSLGIGMAGGYWKPRADSARYRGDKSRITKIQSFDWWGSLWCRLRLPVWWRRWSHCQTIWRRSENQVKAGTKRSVRRRKQRRYPRPCCEISQGGGS